MVSPSLNAKSLDTALLPLLTVCNLASGKLRYGEVSVWQYSKCMKMVLEYCSFTTLNAQCSICNVEIGHYARYAGEACLAIRFDDLNIDARDRWGLDSDTTARSLHVQHDDVLVSGVSAFLVL